MPVRRGAFAEEDPEAAGHGSDAAAGRPSSVRGPV